MTNFTRVESLKAVLPSDFESAFLEAIDRVENVASESAILTRWVLMNEGRPEKVAMALQEGNNVTFPFFLGVTLPEMEDIARAACSDVKHVVVFTKDQLPNAEGWQMLTCNYTPLKKFTTDQPYTVTKKEGGALAEVTTVAGGALMVIAPGCSALVLGDEQPTDQVWALVEELAAVSNAEGLEFSVQAMNPQWSMLLDEHPDYDLNNVTLAKTIH